MISSRDNHIIRQAVLIKPQKRQPAGCSFKEEGLDPLMQFQPAAMHHLRAAAFTTHAGCARHATSAWAQGQETVLSVI